MLVTVCAINYNNSPWVLETLESIHNQSLKKFELIIVDDCSTDDSVFLIEQWLKDKNQSQYTLIKNLQNLGVTKTCNIAIKNAKGNYISLIATDDIMMPDKLKIQVDILENTNENVGVIFSDVYTIDEQSHDLGKTLMQDNLRFKNIVQNENLFRELLKGNLIPAPSVMYKSYILEMVGVYDEELIYEDYDFWLRVAKKYKFVFSDYISVKYRIKTTSLSKIIIDKIDDLKIMNKHLMNESEIVNNRKFEILKNLILKKNKRLLRYLFETKNGKDLYYYFFIKTISYLPSHRLRKKLFNWIK
jgi:glycosyltransferase involved in cell wall biosynthesis